MKSSHAKDSAVVNPHESPIALGGETAEFRPILGRDATAAIRGFAYQAELTVLRWLELRAGETLDLECGEDIDLIGKTVESATGGHLTPELARVLEQVKNQTAPLTLRTPDARATLARFHSHRTANPDTRLLLRYTTTAPLGIERGWAEKGAQSAIEAWQALRKGGLGESDDRTLTTALRELLSDVNPPHRGTTSDEWAAFQAFVRDADAIAFRRFVNDVEWSPGSLIPPALRAVIVERLQAIGLAQDAMHADDVRRRLLAFVWDILTREGTKRLSVDELRSETERTAWSERDRVRVTHLEELLRAIAERIELVERGLEDLSRVHARRFDEISIRIDVLGRQAGIVAALSYVVTTPVIEEPPLVVPATTRAATVRQLLAAHAGTTWFALHGASGTGKSQLALLLARTMAARRIWMSFRDLTPNDAVARLDATLTHVTGTNWPRDDVLIATIGRGACIIVDDVPRFAAGDDLSRRIVALASACRAAEVWLVSTSVHRLSNGVSQQLAPGAVTVMSAPPFNVDETRELLAAHSPPPAMLESHIVALATTVTRGHPVLVQALLRDLEARGWPVTTSEAFVSLASRRPDEAVNAETLYRVLETVEDPTSRELLARLSMIDAEFDVADAQVLSDVAPPIDRPRERLHRLTGLWVQSELRERFTVSPLIRDLGPVDVSAQAINACHIALAQRIVGRVQIGITDFLRAFNHFVQGGEVNTAAFLLLRVLVQSIREKPAAPDRVLTSIWVGTAIPEGVDTTVRVQLRAAQVRARRQSGLPTDELEQEFDHLVAVAPSDDAWAVFGAALIMLVGEFSIENLRASRKYFGLLLSTWSGAQRMWQQHDLDRGRSAEEIAGTLWLALGVSDTRQEVQEWLDLLELTPAELRQAAFTGKPGYYGAVEVTNGLLLAEESRPVSDRDWNAVLQILSRIEEIGDRLGLEVLWASGRSARINVYAEHQEDLGAALRETEEAFARPLGPHARFLIAKAIGFAYVDAGKLPEAEPWLLAALNSGSMEYGEQYIRISLWAAAAIWKRDAMGALRLADRAVEESKTLPDIGKSTVVVALAEAGIHHARGGDLLSAFGCWDEAAEIVFPDIWDDLRAATRLRSIAYPVAYFADVFKNHLPGAGSEHVAIPEPGNVVRVALELRESNAEKVVLHFIVSMMKLANAVGDDVRAVAWAVRGIESARRIGDAAAEGLFAPTWAVAALLSDDEERLLCTLIESGTALNALGEKRRGASAGIGASGENADRLAGDQFAILHGLLPMVLRLGSLVLDSDEQVPAVVARIAAACRAVAPNRPYPAFWNRAAMLVERGFGERPPSGEMLTMANDSPVDDERFAVALRSVGYLAATLDSNMSLGDSLLGHLASLAWLEPHVADYPQLYRATITRFLMTFWRTRFDLGRFRFGVPRLVDESIASLARRSGRDAARPLTRRLIEVLIVSLAVRPPAYAVDWLKTMV